MNEKKFELSTTTKLKRTISTALLLIGIVGCIMGQTPEIRLIAVMALVYSSMFSLDARISALTEIIKDAAKK